MHKIIIILFSLLLPLSAISQDDINGHKINEQSIDDKINEYVAPVTDIIERIIFASFKFEVGGQEIGIPFVLVWLLAGSVLFTLYFNFVNFKQFRLAISIVRGKYTNPKEKGEVSHFQALTAALSGTVGLGNIAGVAIAISLGGPGATFWMIVAGLLGMSSKFVECTLGVKYRQIGEHGKVFGGPMYYLQQGFKDLKMNIGNREHHYGKMGKVLAVFFAIACIGGSIGGGNMFQVNQAFKQFSGMDIISGSWIASNGWFFGLILALIVGVVIIGGIKSIANVTDKIVPFMCGIYVLAAIVVIITNYTEIPTAFMAIMKGAFSPMAVTGGFIGVLIQGFKRAAFSNEAGIGSASIAHSAVKTNNPVSEGLVSLLEPFIDTVVVCTMTALVIVITGEYQNYGGGGTEVGIALTSSAFETVISWFPVILSLAVTLFAFSTMITWSYYGMQSWYFLFGTSKTVEYSYKIIFCLFVVIGAAASLTSVVGFSDAMIFAMCFPNIFGLIFLLPVVKNELSTYLNKIKTGELKAYK